jgi:predicted small metal-binding protein
MDDPPLHSDIAVSGKETIMARKYIDCRDYPQGDKKCTVAISADNEDELIEAAIQHGITVHGYEDTQEFRKELRQSIKTGSPRAT